MYSSTRNSHELIGRSFDIHGEGWVAFTIPNSRLQGERVDQGGDFLLRPEAES